MGGRYLTISFPSPPHRLTGICVCDVEMYTPRGEGEIQVGIILLPCSASDHLIPTLNSFGVHVGVHLSGPRRPGARSGDVGRLRWDVDSTRCTFSVMAMLRQVT
jgi:hypothetical protein